MRTNAGQPMKKWWNRLGLQRWLFAIAVLLFGVSFPLTGRAALVINAGFTDLANSMPGEDLWRANYTISGGSFLANQGFTILFDSLLYKNLSAPVPPISPTWDVLSIQPDVLLSAPGFLDGLALVNNPSLSLPFTLDFVWLGATPTAPAPGPQTFQIYDQGGTFQIIQTGRTVLTVIPEPGAICWSLGLSIFLAVSKRRQRVRGSPGY